MIQLFMETMFKLPFMIDNKFLNVKALTTMHFQQGEGVSIGLL